MSPEPRTPTTLMLRDWKGPYRKRLARALSARGRRMARARWDKERLKPRPEPELKLERGYPLEVGFRDKATGETTWTDFKGVRDVMRRASVVQRLYQPGIQSRP